VNTWAEDFLSQLDKIKQKQKEFEFMFLDNEAKFLLLDKYRRSQKRLLLLDYDGTLVPFSSFPDLSKPDKTVVTLLKDLSADSRNLIYIISGRDSETLQSWLGHLPLHLIAEHGAMTKSIANGWKTDFEFNIDENWKFIIASVMETYVKRCANSFIEMKNFSVAWHYRNADPEQAKIRCAELFSELTEHSNYLNVQVVQGNKVVEVRIKGIDKAYIVKKLLKDNYDFILACGDDSTDEEMFRMLANNENAFTIKIGDEASFAKYNLYTPQMTVSLLKLLTDSVWSIH
jgi:trehalose 6-phosphate synthase/phosphatase